MPVKKPDNNEIRAFLKAKGYKQDKINLFHPVYVACKSVIEDGFIMKEGAIDLKNSINAIQNVSNIFPNNLLLKLIEGAIQPGSWNHNVENLLLNFIFQFYINDTHDSANVGIAISFDHDPVPKEPNFMPGYDNYRYFYADNDFKKLLDENFDMIFDRLPDGVTIENNLCAITGSIKGFTRSTCFEAIRKLGGCPSESHAADLLFVSDTHYESRSISGKTSNAISIRRVRGNPLILREDDWHRLVS